MGTEIIAAFNSVYSDGPASNPDEPSKSLIKSVIGPTIQNSIDSAKAEIEELDDRVAQVESSQGADAIAAATKTALDSLAVTLGLGAGDQGKIGRVYQDATAANNGDYTWTGSAWTYVGLDRLGKVEAAVSAPISSFDGDLIYDENGVLGIAKTLYVPRALYARVGTAVLQGSYGTASVAIPTHVALTATNNSLATVYIDLDDTTSPVKVANFTDLPTTAKPNKIIIVAEIRTGRVKSPHPVLKIDENIRDRIMLRFPLVVDGDKLLVPAFYHYRRSSNFTLYAPADGSLYWEFDLSTVPNSETRYYFDRLAAEAGSVPVKAVSALSFPTFPESELMVLIASSLNRVVKTDHPIAGNAAGGTLPNLFERGNDPDRAVLFAGDTTVADITNPDLIAFDITRGVTGTEAYYGAKLPDDVPADGFFFARLYIEASVANNFQSPRLFFLDENGTAIVTSTLILEKKISTTAAIYGLMGRYSFSQRPVSFNVGTAQASAFVKVAGAQVYLGREFYGWIARGEYPLARDGDILYGPRHFAVAGREIPFFLDGLIAEREDRECFRLVVSKDAASAATLPYVASGGDMLSLDYSKATGAVSISVEGESSNRSRRYQRSVTVQRTTAPVAGAVNVLALGDSITNRSFLDKVSAKLAAIGVTPTFLGTINNSGVNGEGRESWEWSDYIYSKTQFAPVAPGAEAAYLARSTDGNTQLATDRWNFNPFIKAAAAGPGVYNGYTFDLDFYLDRFSFADPDFVLINLGTNDIRDEEAEAALLQIQQGLEVIIPNIRASRPAARIGIGLPTVPRANISDAKWRFEQVPAIRLILSYVAGLADANIDILPYWAHMSTNVGWSTTAVSSEAGQTLAKISDEFHPQEINRHYMAEVAAQWIACKKAGL